MIFKGNKLRFVPFNFGNPTQQEELTKNADFTLFKQISTTDKCGAFLHFGLSQDTTPVICFVSISL